MVYNFFFFSFNLDAVKWSILPETAPRHDGKLNATTVTKWAILPGIALRRRLVIPTYSAITVKIWVILPEIALMSQKIRCRIYGFNTMHSEGVKEQCSPCRTL